MESINTDEIKKWDRAGVFLSTLCALHCLLTPFITLSLPLWVYSIHYSPAHLFIAIFIIPVAVYAFWTGYKKHENKRILILGGAGLFLLSIALIGPSTRNQLRWNDIMTIIGSMFLITGHFLNLRSLKKT
jgi:uncharacterized membrane protein